MDLPSLSDTTDLSRNLLFTVQRIKTLHKDYEGHRLELEQMEAQDISLESQQHLAEASREVYRKVIDEVYLRSLGRIEDTINDALKFIFSDRMYSAKLEVGDNRGKTMEILLYDNGFNPPRIVNMKTGVGNGIRSVVSFVLLSFYLIARGRAPVIFADEAYSAISEGYVERFFQFAKSLCKARDVVLVIVTHDPRFLVYADRRYQVSEGDVELKVI